MGKGSYIGGSSIINSCGFNTFDDANPKNGKNVVPSASLTKAKRKAMRENGKMFLNSSRIFIQEPEK